MFEGWVAAGAVVGSAVVGGVMASKGASKAADASKAAAQTQADASAYAADIQKQMFDKQVELQAPFRQAGIAALSQLSSLMSPYSNFFPSVGAAPGTPNVTTAFAGGAPGGAPTYANPSGLAQGPQQALPQAPTTMPGQPQPAPTGGAFNPIPTNPTELHGALQLMQNNPTAFNSWVKANPNEAAAIAGGAGDGVLGQLIKRKMSDAFAAPADDGGGRMTIQPVMRNNVGAIA